MQSMTASYPPDVWEACEIPHPEHEREKERLAVIAAQEDEAKKAAETIRGKAFEGTASRGGAGKYIQKDKDQEEEGPVPLHQEKAIAWLAQQSGWSVLDVEEVHDIFMRHAHEGAVGLHGSAFQVLLQDVFRGP